MKSSQYKRPDIKKIFAVQSVRLRPAMYVGQLDKKGIYRMLESFIINLIESVGLKEVQIEFKKNNKICVSSSKIDFNRLIEAVGMLKSEYDLEEFDLFRQVADLIVIVGLSKEVNLEISVAGKKYVLTANKGIIERKVEKGVADNTFFIELIPDAQIFKDIDVDFEQFNEVLKRIAYLNTEIKIVSIHDAGLEYQRLVFHYPKGVFHLMDNLMSNRLIYNHTICHEIDTEYDGFRYRITICSQGFAACPHVQSFAGYSETLFHGSLIEGIAKGILKAVKLFAKGNEIEIDISEDMLKQQGFIIIASLTGPRYNFKGPLKQRLDMPDIEEDTEYIVSRELSEYFVSNPQKAINFVNYFKVK